MSSVRPGMPGATRVCPHCKSTVLESAAVCPGCRHHLRFNAGNSQFAADESYRALSIDGTIAHKVGVEQCEYCVVIDIRNERGEQVIRHVVGVGALQPGELRRLNVAIDMMPVRVQAAAKTSASLQAPTSTATKAPSAPLKPPPLQPPPAMKPSTPPTSAANKSQHPAAKPATSSTIIKPRAH